MIWLKSFAFGVGGALLAFLIMFISLSLILNSGSSSAGVGIDVVAFARMTIVRLILASVFALAFIWEYRRAGGK